MDWAVTIVSFIWKASSTVKSILSIAGSERRREDEAFRIHLYLLDNHSYSITVPHTSACTLNPPLATERGRPRG